MLHLVVGGRQNRGVGEQMLHVLLGVEDVTRLLLLGFTRYDLLSFHVQVPTIHQYTPLRISCLVCCGGDIDIRILLDSNFFQTPLQVVSLIAIWPRMIMRIDESKG